MTEHPYIAMCRAIKNRLTDTAELWGQQVGEVPLTAWVKPYVQFYFISGMDTNFQVIQDATYEMGIKVVSLDMEQSLIGAARLTALLDDQGVQDRPTTPLYGGTDWEIATVTQGRVIHIVETFAKSVPIFHDGWVFTFVLGRL
jgi:hypothetical protein